MGARSTNYIDIYNWLIDVINSCETIEHCYSARNLIENFQKKGKPLDILDLKTMLNRKITTFKNETGKTNTEAQTSNP